MGTVWLADHSTLGLRCAVKFASAEAEREPFFRERFEREARAVARLDCPNVVRVLDYDTFEGVPFLAMEWLSGEDLETRLRREGRLEASEVHRIVSQVAQGLERAHAAGIVHRDLKPGNVFIANTDDGEVAKILDFGLAKVASGDATAMTQAGTVLGTPVYMSPEQARSVSEVDERSDLWSLAVITYECLLGKLPFDGPSLGEVFARIMFEPIPVPSEVDPTVPALFDRWWKRAASRDVDGRFGSALEMTDALREALGLDDVRSQHTPLPALATAHTVPPPRRRPSRRWAAAVVFATLGIAGWRELHAGRSARRHAARPPLRRRRRHARGGGIGIALDRAGERGAPLPCSCVRLVTRRAAGEAAGRRATRRDGTDRGGAASHPAGGFARHVGRAACDALGHHAGRPIDALGHHIGRATCARPCASRQ